MLVSLRQNVTHDARGMAQSKAARYSSSLSMGLIPPLDLPFQVLLILPFDPIEISHGVLLLQNTSIPTSIGQTKVILI